MTHPKITFDFDRDLDQNLAGQFYNDPHLGGADFWWSCTLTHHLPLAKMETAHGSFPASKNLSANDLPKNISQPLRKRIV